MKRLAIVLPAFNEADNVGPTTGVLLRKLDELVARGMISPEYLITFVDDGSKDGTWDAIVRLNQSNPHVNGVRLSRNFGHQAAMLAGLEQVHGHGDIVLTMDADLQHDPDAIADFVALANQGNEVVFGVRLNRTDETMLKKALSGFFYRAMAFLGAEVIRDHADYRLMSARAIRELLRHEERNLFLRGIIPTLGFKSAILHYRQLNRERGESKYSISKMVNLALNGVTSFSTRPLRLILLLGFVALLVSLVGAGHAIYSYLSHQTVPGWSSIITAIYLLGGVQLVCMGILGEYLGKIYSETKRRPLFIVQESTLANPTSGQG